MTVRTIKNAADVARWRLCLGCGACVPACPNNNIQLVDIQDHGLRPVLNEAKCQQCGQCIRVCPGIDLSQQPFNSETIPQLRQAWGPVLEIWEGYAADPEIRFEGSSGGAATALALFCLEKQNFAGILHIGTKPEAPLRNVPVFSKSREDLLRHTGSRYSPAALCEQFNRIEQSRSPCVFIGKPCDVAALRKAQANSAELSQNTALAISIFCAGTPTTAGTHKLLNVLGIKPEDVKEIRYRGYGWPGNTTVKAGKNDRTYQMTYNESWGSILSKYVQVRCRLCPDGTGEFADISCGDPWHEESKQDEAGQSLVIVRTERGRRILHKTMEAGYIRLEEAKPQVLAASQKALLNRRRHLFGRLLAMHIMGIPAPHFEGFSLFSNWRDLLAREKIRSIAGTLKRIFQRNWTKPLKISQDG